LTGRVLPTADDPPLGVDEFRRATLVEHIQVVTGVRTLGVENDDAVFPLVVGDVHVTRIRQTTQLVNPVGDLRPVS
jgi:hypothetical protein